MMKKQPIFKKLTLLMILMPGVFIITCKENEKDLPEKSGKDYMITAGLKDTNIVNHLEFEPALQIKGSRIGPDSNYFYKDSVRLDLNRDGIKDVQFRYISEFHQPVYNCEGIDCCAPWGSSRCEIQSLSNLEMASNNQSSNEPLQLAYGDTINKHLFWARYSGLKMFAAGGLNNGWNTNNNQNFMGFRLIEKSDTVYGWLRLNTPNADKIEIYEIGIEKSTN